MKITSVKIVGSGVVYGIRLFEIQAQYDGKARPVRGQVFLSDIRRESGNARLSLAATKQATEWLNTQPGLALVEKEIGLRI